MPPSCGICFCRSFVARRDTIARKLVRESNGVFPQAARQ